MLDDRSPREGSLPGGVHRVHHDAVVGVADTGVGSREWYNGQSKARFVPLQGVGERTA